jgi:hypothetical protein
VSHAVLRLPGESTGADNEVKLANQLNIPVFHDMETLVKALPTPGMDGLSALMMTHSN